MMVDVHRQSRPHFHFPRQRLEKPLYVRPAPMGKIQFRFLLLIAVFAAIGIAVVAWRLKPPPPRPPVAKEAQLSDEELLEAARQARAAIGLLENEKFVEADAILAGLAQKLPAEPLVARNLAIGRVLQLESAASTIAVDEVEQALNGLAKIEPQLAVSNWLAARAYLKLAEKNFGSEAGAEYRSAALKQLAEATRLEPDNAAFWYQIYESAKDSEDPAQRDQAYQALDRAFQADPDNLRVTLDWLATRAVAKDTKLGSALPAIRALIEPIAPAVQRRTNTDVLVFLDQIRESAETSEWNVARTAATKLRNFLISEELTRSDQRRVLKNPLEFASYDFGPEIRERLAKISIPTPPGIAVRLVPCWADPLPADVQDAKFADMDLDGRWELVLLKSESIEVYRIQPDLQIGEVLLSAAIPAGMTHLLVADLDRDTILTAGSVKAAAELPNHKFTFFEADADIVAYGPAGVRVLKNELTEDGRVRKLDPVAQDAAFEALKRIVAGTLADIDHDGDLDLLLSVDGKLQVWWNRDNLTFEDATKWSQLPPEDLRLENFVVVDWDRDLDLDVVVSGKQMLQSGLLENLRHGQLKWRPFEDRFDAVGSAARLLVREADGNGSWDLLAAGARGVHSIQTTTIPAKSVSPLRVSAIADGSFEDALSLDYDNDGFADLFVSSPDKTQLYRGDREGQLRVTTDVLPDAQPRKPVDTVDVDVDGDLDVLTLSAGKVSLLRNEGGSQNHWLSVRVRGEAVDRSGRVNHYGLGSLLELRAGTWYQAQTVQKQVAHFGLGDASADVLRVLFTNGIPQSVLQPPPDQLISEMMVNKGSCPFAYGWNGERFEFITDLLWNAPLGLQLADGVIARDRPWEFLKIAANQLVSREGFYELQITEELWEAGYFDQIALIAVDHPADIEIFSNEKVGPAEIAEQHVHTVRDRRQLAGARNHRGRNLLRQLSKVDGDMAVAFDRTLRKGRAEDHYLELDFGAWEEPRQITLFLTGWIQPGDTSLNVAASHNPNFGPGQPPSVWTPDAHGEWKQSVPFMGFPGGKPKTIAIDLSRAFHSSDHRLRIATNFELYWDEAFFTVDEMPGENRIRELPLVSADLHFRGFSAVTPNEGPRPEAYDYSHCVKTASWPPMQGKFTRYGSVMELLTKTDGRLAVLAAGDELTLRFTSDPPPPRGWVRDFFLHNVGWDKDADLNTVVGQTVEPLPYVGMPRYPYVSEADHHGSPAGATAEFERYLREYQTRESDPSLFWNDVVLPK